MRGRNVMRYVLKGNFAVTDGTVKAIPDTSYILDIYYVSWNKENIIQLDFSINPPYKLNSDYADYGWWDDDKFSIASTIKSKVETRRIFENSYDYTFINQGNNQYGIKADNSSLIDSITGLSAVNFTDKSIIRNKNSISQRFNCVSLYVFICLHLF